jgi:DNA-binding CsgD family transcriptional regulator
MPPIKRRVAQLSPRQREVVRLTSLGCTQEEIASILKLTLSTVNKHVGRAMKVLGVNNPALLTRIAIECRLSPAGDSLTPAERRRRGKK